MTDQGGAKWTWGNDPAASTSSGRVPAPTGVVTPTPGSQPSTPALDDDDVMRARLDHAIGAEYELQGELGRGGMAVVFRAVERASGATVAIKVIRGDQLRDPESRARFEREAALTAEFDSPHLVRTFAIREVPPRGLAIAMEFMGGGTLKERVRRDGRLPIADVLSIMADIARGLAHAHDKGVVHRDLKPENVFLSADGRNAKVGDFGIARATAADTLTLTGTVIGTPAYMSPEQIDGQRVDHRSDLYSLGLIVWEMLTGTQPWEGETLFSTIHKQKLVDLPAPSAQRGDIPVVLEGLLRRCLAKEANSRPPSAAAVLRVLTADGAGDAGLETRPSVVASGVALAAHTVRWRSERGATEAEPPAASHAPESRTARVEDVASLQRLGWVVALTSVIVVVASLNAWLGATRDVVARAQQPRREGLPLHTTYANTPFVVDSQVANAAGELARPVLSDVTIRTNESAEIEVRSTRDNQVVAQGSGQVLTASLAPGGYRAVARSPYGGEQEQEFTLARRTGATIDLQFPLEGSLAIASDEGFPTIHLDGRDVGEPPLEVSRVASGEHQVTATWPDGRTTSVLAKVFGGRTATIKLSPP